LTYSNIILEKFLVFIEDILIVNGTKENQKYLPIAFILFFSLLLTNIGGMFPYNFTLTSHLFITLFFAFICFFGINFTAIKRHGIKFFNLFLPKDTPIFLVPLLVFIEMLSYFSRLLSLGIRLFANMMAGHTLLKILSNFLFLILNSGGIFILFDIIPIIIFLLVIVMELAIAFLQVYVFVVLYSIYLKDVYIIGH